jgi:hypothetical protein
MRIHGPIAPTNPFHIARAYGVDPARPAPAASANAGQVNGPKSAQAVSQLVAAVVPGRVDFDSARPATGDSMELYRRPADRNIAATGVGLGKVIDVSG